MKSISKILLAVAIAATPAIAEDAAALEAAFKKLDTNTDGSLSLDEFKASPEGVKDPAKAEAKFKKLDTNTDGSLSLDEYKAQ
jgi:Ca2+-binding EF-hand superfamily protein